MWPLILDRPLHLDLSATSLLVGLGMFCVVWLVWLRFVAFMGNYRAGEESGSARWGTLKEGKAFKDQTRTTASPCTGPSTIPSWTGT